MITRSLQWTNAFRVQTWKKNSTRLQLSLSNMFQHANRPIRIFAASMIYTNVVLFVILIVWFVLVSSCNLMYSLTWDYIWRKFWSCAESREQEGDSLWREAEEHIWWEGQGWDDGNCKTALRSFPEIPQLNLFT